MRRDSASCGMVREKASIAAAKPNCFRQGFVRGAAIACCAADVLSLHARHARANRLHFGGGANPLFGSSKQLFASALSTRVLVSDTTLEGGGHDASRADHRGQWRHRPLLAGDVARRLSGIASL